MDDAYLVLARKWRPRVFEEITGQAHITRTLQNAIQANRLAHAYLFTGVRGVGKTTAARILAKALNCEAGPTPIPCDRCTPCREITSGTAIDVLEIDGASNRGIDEIRQIIENVRYQPARCRFKIYIIDEVHQVTKDAFNALLKTLEEPPPSVKFILATTEPHRLPETILSRCQRYDFRRIPFRQIIERLKDIAREEGLQISDGALALLAREADGSMRDAQSLLEQVLASIGSTAEKGAPVNETDLYDLLGLAERRLLYEISRAVIGGEASRCVELVSATVAQGRDLHRLSKDLVEHFRNLLVARLLEERRSGSPADGSGAELLDLPDQELAELLSQTRDVPVDALLDYFDFMASGDEAVARSTYPRFALEAALVRLATLPRTLPVAELIERLEKLEKKLSSGAPSSSSQANNSLSERRTASAPSEKSGVGSVGRDRVWRDFVSFVAKEKKLLASHLESGSAVDLAPGTITIGITERHHLSYLQDAENLSLLKNFATRFFATETMIRFTQVPPSERSGVGERGNATDPAEAGSAVVKEALRIFSGAKTVRRDS